MAKVTIALKEDTMNTAYTNNEGVAPYVSGIVIQGVPSCAHIYICTKGAIHKGFPHLREGGANSNADKSG